MPGLQVHDVRYFEAKDQYERPKPEIYPAVDPYNQKRSDWDAVVFQRTPTSPDSKDSSKVGGCYYADSQLPNDSKGSCKVAD